jgi:hypothetical protein
VRFWNRALTAAEVQLVSTNVIPPDGLVAEYLLEPDAAPRYDRSARWPSRRVVVDNTLAVIARHWLSHSAPSFCTTIQRKFRILGIQGVDQMSFLLQGNEPGHRDFFTNICPLYSFAAGN